MLPQRYNFPIVAPCKVSMAFRERGIIDLSGAIQLITDFPYGRNANKENPVSVFTDGCGTCSTKHALLKQLADEHNVKDIQLMLCIFKMTPENTPTVKRVIEKYGLPYISEAHNYLRVGGEIVDCTKKHWSVLQFLDDVLEEQEIEADEITGFKMSYHRKFLGNWLEQHPQLSYSLDELYEIREECIRVLGAKS